jgi:histone demethylase JARID1
MHYNVSSAEERFLHQALQNSKLDFRRVDGKLDIPSAPTFFPTVEEFEAGPMAYIEKIRHQAQKYGICKVVPPSGWNPEFCIDMKSTKKFETKEQHLHRLQEGISFGDGQEYTAAEYQEMASIKAKQWKHENYPDHDLVKQHAVDGEDAARKLFSPENLERDYWDIVETHNREMTVEYGNDIDVTSFGSGFPLSERGRAICGRAIPEKMAKPEPKFGEPDFYKETWWNLNNIPRAQDSVLQYVKVGINGVNVPWMYFGSLFSTFCYHNEDNYLYSINYHHRGAPKQWYGVPGTKNDSDGLEKVFKSYLSMKMRDVPDLLHHITTMFSPRLLQNNNVKSYKLLQHAGEFVVTFPRSFHGGFSLGPNVGEAVNFATHDWISFGSDANERYRSFARPAVFSHDRLTFTMANHLEDQKSYHTCKSLLTELQRVVEEELSLRSKLMESGVRNVSDLISLPRNRLDQLDEESADYDDKRLCHACKHVCFFSAVACECSHSKVSCLRHSHYMCRCPTERKYLMIWSDENELKTTLKKVEDYCFELKARSPSPVETPDSATSDSSSLAPGVERDQLAHKNEEISLEPVGADPNYKPSAQNRPEVSVTRAKMCMGGASLEADAEDSRTPVLSEDKDSSDEDTERNVAQPTASDDGAGVASADDVEQDVQSQFADAE